LSGLQSRDQDH